MQEQLSELARKYQEEMLRMYGKRQPSEISPPIAADAPAAPVTQEMPDEPEPTELPPEPEPLADEPDLPDPSENMADYGDPELPAYIQPTPPKLPEEWAEQEAYENRNTAKGYLRIVTAAADSAYPVPDARVSVFTRIGSVLHLSYLLLTNENGETPTVTLPAPPADLSQSPDNERPFASCEIRIAAKGFFRTQATDVHIFAGITTRQEFQLVPLPLYYEPSDGGIDPNEIGRTEDCQGGAPC